MQIDGQHDWKIGWLDGWMAGWLGGWRSGASAPIYQSSSLPVFQSSNLPTIQVTLLVIVLALILTGCGSYEFNGTEYVDAQAAADFELMASNGERYRLSDHQGQIVLMFFWLYVLSRRLPHHLGRGETHPRRPG